MVSQIGVNPAQMLPSVPAAKYLGMLESWLRKTRMNGRTDGPPFMRIGGAIRYRLADLERWLDQRRCGGTTRPAPELQPEPPPRGRRPKAITRRRPRRRR